MEQERKLNGQLVVLLTNEEFSSYTVRHKIIQHCKLPKMWWLNLYSNHSTKCETAAKIQDKQVTILWTNAQ
jgi:hypothetical protein